MKKIRVRQYVVFLLLSVPSILAGCSKASFLDKKPNTQLVVPTTLTDCQTLLDNQTVMQETPELGELSSDNYYVAYTTWQTLTTKPHNAYVWAQDLYGELTQIQDYNLPYQQVFYANVVLDALIGINVEESNRQQWNTIKGTAHFLRAYAFYNLAQLFAPVYDQATATTDWGIALRLQSNVNAKSERASVQATYDQILADLHKADSLLPNEVPSQNLNRPSRPAVLAMLARVYLSMRVYDKARVSANNSLQLYDSLINYDSVDYTAFPPIPEKNPETLYQSILYSGTELMLGGNFRSVCIVDSNLYASYASGDLRRVIFYRKSGITGLSFPRWSYSGKSYCFSGLAEDEVYLIRAECAARAGNKDAALADLNKLLQHRWVRPDSIPYIPVVAASAQAALDSILVERRKELAFRGLRWTDIRRLNKEGNITMTHGLNGQQYQLPPGSPNYIFYLPPDVIRLSGMPDYKNRVQINPN